MMSSFCQCLRFTSYVFYHLIFTCFLFINLHAPSSEGSHSHSPESWSAKSRAKLDLYRERYVASDGWFPPDISALPPPPPIHSANYLDPYPGLETYGAPIDPTLVDPNLYAIPYGPIPAGVGLAAAPLPGGGYYDASYSAISLPPADGYLDPYTPKLSPPSAPSPYLPDEIPAPPASSSYEAPQSPSIYETLPQQPADLSSDQYVIPQPPAPISPQYTTYSVSKDRPSYLGPVAVKEKPVEKLYNGVETSIQLLEPGAPIKKFPVVEETIQQINFHTEGIPFPDTHLLPQRPLYSSNAVDIADHQPPIIPEHLPPKPGSAVVSICNQCALNARGCPRKVRNPCRRIARHWIKLKDTIGNQFRKA